MADFNRPGSVYHSLFLFYLESSGNRAVSKSGAGGGVSFPKDVMSESLSFCAIYILLNKEILLTFLRESDIYKSG